MGLGFFMLEFPGGITQFCRISRGESLFSPEFLSKVTNLKIQGGFLRKVYPLLNPLCSLDFFLPNTTNISIFIKKQGLL